MLKLEELEKIRQFIYKETGMLFEGRKDYYLQTRVDARMLETRINSFAGYYQELLFGARGRERQKFIESVTINETYFFRDFPQLQGFAEAALPSYCAGKAKLHKETLKIWSAACSTGEEAYTLAIILLEAIPEAKRWALQIDATDIDTKVLASAAAGLYGERSMKDTPLSYRDKYFRKVGDSWAVQANAANLVKFKPLNFIDQPAMRGMRGYDFIFCRNVLIYFDESSRKAVVNGMYDALLPGGYLFLGHSESIGRITSAFELERLDGLLFHRKPAKNA